MLGAVFGVVPSYLFNLFLHDSIELSREVNLKTPSTAFPVAQIFSVLARNFRCRT